MEVCKSKRVMGFCMPERDRVAMGDVTEWTCNSGSLGDEIGRW